MKIKCSGCGQEKNTNPKAYEARIAKFGSLEEAEKKWLCRACRVPVTPVMETEK